MIKKTIEKPEKELKVSSLDILEPSGTYIRSFSKEVHGEDFKELAKEFAGKVEGRKIVASASIKKPVKEEVLKEGEKEKEPEEGEVE